MLHQLDLTAYAPGTEQVYGLTEGHMRRALHSAHSTMHIVAGRASCVKFARPAGNESGHHSDESHPRNRKMPKRP
ncbi:hypothetical protein ABIC02_007854 [Bradyrhizobium sp. RT5a]